MNNNTVIIIAGPTASGKTSLGIEIAKKLNGEIVSADSMQIYKGMDIATAKPTVLEMNEVKHHLVGFLPPSEQFSVAKYKDFAFEAIDNIICREKKPIVVGGTGLYIDCLINNTTFYDYEESNVRKDLEEQVEKFGIEPLYEKLKSIDPQCAQKLHLNDKKRIIRAVELFYLTGKTISLQNEASHINKSKYNFCLIGLTAYDRQFIYNRINQRVDIMLKSGLIEEAKNFYNCEISVTSKQAIGYKELKPFLDGDCSIDQAVEKLKMETRRYAKRQLTWLRRYKDINWIYIDKDNVSEKCLQIINDFERKNVNEE